MELAPKAILGLFAACLLVVPASAQAPCDSDLNTDRVVDGTDLGILLGAWGPCAACAADINSDGFTDGTDLGILLGAWGPCPVVTPSWATLVEAHPSPAVVTDLALRQRIASTGLAWRVRDTATQIEMLLVPPGSFWMGCSPDDLNTFGWYDEIPYHPVVITQPFYLGRFEVTQDQWTAQMGSNPSFHRSATLQVPASQVGSRPVEHVSWSMAESFLSAANMRFPSEAEWEYACRAGTTSAFNAGGWIESVLLGCAWFATNSVSQTRPVGLKSPNRLGFHDMHGNVREWVRDWYSHTYYSSGDSVDPQGPANGNHRVRRGGSFQSNMDPCRSSHRFGTDSSGGGTGDVGIRVARNP